MRIPAALSWPCVLLLACAGPCARALADVPVAPPPAAPAPQPAATPEPAPGHEWSPAPVAPPAAAPAGPPPGRAAVDPSLRSPVVRRAGSVAGAPAAPIAPVAVAPAPAAAPAAAAAGATVAASILQVGKQHNVPLTDGTLALALRTTFRVEAPEGGTFRVWASFHDGDSGEPIRSTRPSFAKPGGQAHVVTLPVAGAAGETFDAPLLVPYTVFPNPGEGKTLPVQARIELTQVGADGREVVVARATSTFRVHGA